MNIAKIRASLLVEGNPGLKSFNFQILKIDISSQVKRIEVFNPDFRGQLIDLPELSTRRGIVEVNARHLDSSRWERRMKLFDRCLDSVFGKRIGYLPGHISIYITKAIKEEGEQEERKNPDTNDEARQNSMAARKVTPAALGRGRRRITAVFWSFGIVYTHNL